VILTRRFASCSTDTNAPIDAAPMMPSAPPARAAVPSWPEVDWVCPAARIELPPAAGWYGAFKPASDYVLALLIGVVALPVVGVCWALVKLSSRGPGFYTQTRAGLGGRPYTILKLRTMAHNVEAATGIQWSQKGDCRVTGVGKFLRTTHLDELPQLLNVLRGDMSLVGPRPERPEIIAAKGLSRQVPGYDRRLDVKPGVTGFAQLQLPPDSTVTSVRHKVAYDLYYVANQTLWFDLRLIAATAAKTLGLKPVWLRRLFALPPRPAVGAGYRALTPADPPAATDSASGLLPV